jgi:hypothetical protein
MIELVMLGAALMGYLVGYNDGLDRYWGRWVRSMRARKP